jgi:hypothetical protein
MSSLLAARPLTRSTRLRWARNLIVLPLVQTPANGIAANGAVEALRARKAISATGARAVSIKQPRRRQRRGKAHLPERN